ncbi:serine hydrolase domain-containing protein [Changchengzhania lutea]|uniref:serine hydrolase domain-containing protein n=1 Tax=Changchengzhania lutea TaxID=2049305 RepID=UPI001C8F4248|nr:serine hydrolase [Changchengzhania lutea]
MKNKTGLLLLILLIITNSSFAQQSDPQAPEATSAEVRLLSRDLSELKDPFIDATPTDRKDGILVGELGIDGGNKAMIIKLAQEIADNKHGPFDSFLIAHKGKLIFESYYSRGRINLPHYQASATKTYTGFALGRAIQLGYLTMADLDKPLVSFLKDLDPTKFVAGVEKITLHHALTMTSGIRITKEQEEEFKKNPSLLKGQGKVQAILEHSTPITIASQSFKYGGGPELVMQVIDAVVPGSAKDFIKKELLDKLGITNYGWRTDNVTGLPESGWRSSMTSRDMVKWGTLAVNKGKWNGEQLVPEAFIDRATSRILYTGDDDPFGGGKDVSDYGYGYFWWNAELKSGNKSYFSTSAQGGHGQFIILIEELDLMVVVTAHDTKPSTLQKTAERILPAFIQNSIQTMNGKSDSQDKFPVLEGPYFGEKPPGSTPEIFAPGIISLNGRTEYGISFSPKLDEVYFSAKNKISGDAAIYFSKLEGKKWTPIKKANFTKGKKDTEMQPFVSFSGKKIYFTAHNSDLTDSKIWYVNRLEDSWGDAIQLDSPINDDEVFHASPAKNGDLFYFNLSKMKLYYAPNKNDEFPEVQEVEIEFGFHGFIAPSQDFLVVDARNKDDKRKDNDLYVYFKKQDGTWTKPINLGKEVNSNFNESVPSITPDGKYLFFSRKTEEGGLKNFYWVSTEVIHKLKKAYFKKE